MACYRSNLPYLHHRSALRYRRSLGGEKTNEMIYSNSNSERHFSGEVEKTNDIVLTDELVCEHLPYSEVKSDLQTELLFCSTLVLTELFTNPLFQ